jgi:eukaryotic-like serine/threonine-protein kinase
MKPTFIPKRAFIFRFHKAAVVGQNNMASKRELVEQLFEAALELEQGEREAFLAKACVSNLTLKAQVEGLLAQNERIGSFLDEGLPVQERFRQHYAKASACSTCHSRETQEEHQSASRSQFREGDILANRFLVVRFIAKGGMGEVYEVEDRQLQGVHLALKTVLPHIAADPSALERFEREVLLARKVVHPNLCPIYDIFHCDYRNDAITFLTMKLLSGQTLSATIRERGRMDLVEARLIVQQVGDALSAAHKGGILHRDIKSVNIMLDGHGDQVNAFVTDFGLARALRSETTSLSKDGIAGTPGYLAPELLRGMPASRASDIYAFGVVIYEMLCGHLPIFSSESRNGMIDDPVLAELPTEWKNLLVGCLEPDASGRFQTIPDAMAVLGSNSERSSLPSLLTRRQAIGLTAGGTLALAAAASWKWQPLHFLFEPLPNKRFVALMAWPTPDSESAAIVSTVLNSIASRLARAESYVKNLLIISSTDIADDGKVLKSPSESVTALGANLVLAASLHEEPASTRLNLRILDAASQKEIRKTDVSTPTAQLSELADKGSDAALRLLGLPQKVNDSKDPDELRSVSVEAFRIFSEAEHLADEPNDTALDAAVMKYQEALSIDPRFALCYAKLALAYIRQYLNSGDAGPLLLAENNARLALHYHPDSAKGLLSQAIVLLCSGKTSEALSYFAASLKIDPGNPETKLFKAQAFRDLSRWPEAEGVYRDILNDRPNYWPAYNELGWILSRQAKYKEASEAFAAGSAAAPNVALPLANLGTTYLQLGKRSDAVETLNRSLKRGPTEIAFETLGDIAFEDQDYRKSLEYFEKARDVNPNSYEIWRDIGDSYAMLGQEPKVQESYQRAVDLIAQRLRRNPRRGTDWMELAFFQAKVGLSQTAEASLKEAENRGARDVESQFTKAQVLALLGEKEEALKLVLKCMDDGITPLEIDLAVDLKAIRTDPRYKRKLAELTKRT